MNTVLSFTTWTTRGVAEETALQPYLDAGVPRAVAEVLVRRGHTSLASARTFFQAPRTDLHDPSLLPDMPAAVTRLQTAIARNEPVVIYGDYDADGVTSTAILLLGLQRLGLTKVTAVVPERLERGRTLSEALERATETGATLLITIDCGVRAVDEIAQAARIGVDVIVVDHHPAGDVLPACVAVVNPQRADSVYPERELCAGALAFKLMWAVWRERKGQLPNLSVEDLREFHELAAVATLADSMPLVGENRALVKHALKGMTKAGARNPGLAALLQAGLRRGDTRTTVQTRDLSSTVVPRLNALGRMGSAHRALALLAAGDLRIAKGLVTVASLENDTRRREEQRVFDDACALLEEAPDDQIIVIASDRWHPGVVGPVASRLSERYGRAAIVMAIEGDVARGSGRAPRGWNLRAILERVSSLTVRNGGHERACGVEVRRAQLAAFTTAVHEAAETLAPDTLQTPFDVEAWVDVEHLGAEVMTYLERMEPFGPDNPAPVFGVKNVYVQRAERSGTADLKGRVIRPGAPVSGIAFRGVRLAEHYPPEWLAGQRVDAIGQLEKDDRTGEPLFRVLDLRLCA